MANSVQHRWCSICEKTTVHAAKMELGQMVWHCLQCIMRCYENDNLTTWEDFKKEWTKTKTAGSGIG